MDKVFVYVLEGLEVLKYEYMMYIVDVCVMVMLCVLNEGKSSREARLAAAAAR